MLEAQVGVNKMWEYGLQMIILPHSITSTTYCHRPDGNCSSSVEWLPLTSLGHWANWHDIDHCWSVAAVVCFLVQHERWKHQMRCLQCIWEKRPPCWITGEIVLVNMNVGTVASVRGHGEISNVRKEMWMVEIAVKWVEGLWMLQQGVRLEVRKLS